VVSLAEGAEGTAMTRIRKILHPTDFSDSSHLAFRLACSLAGAHGARVHVLHVGRHPVISPVEGSTEPACYREGLTEKLHGLVADEPGIQVEHQLLFAGDPGPEILRVAKQIGADPIVLGTHGRTGLSRLLMGSVAEQVVRRAGCPVLTVKVSPATGNAGEEAATVSPAWPGRDALC
jgi:nucleotide-binding universal stress UspA family protein